MQQFPTETDASTEAVFILKRRVLCVYVRS